MSGFIMALPVIAPTSLPPNLARIFLNTIASAILYLRLTPKLLLPCAASSRLFLPASTPITKSLRGSPPSSSIFAQSPS